MDDQKEPELKEVVNPSCNGAESGAYNRSQLPELLRVYYKWLFPYDKYFEWLQYGKQSAVFSCIPSVYSQSIHKPCALRLSCLHTILCSLASQPYFSLFLVGGARCWIVRLEGCVLVLT